MHLFCKHIIYILAASLLIVSCKKDEEKDPPTPSGDDYGTTNGRTVLVYAIADNDMASIAVNDISEMLAGAKYMGKKDHLIVYLDDKQKPRIYDINVSSVGTAYSNLTPIYQYEEEVNSCSYEQLSSVIKYTIDNFPAPSYGLVMWSHGNGWLPTGQVYPDYVNKEAYNIKARSFGLDYNYVSGKRTDNNGKQMSIETIRNGIDAFGGLDFLMFDACMMQNIEVDYQLRGKSKAIIGSPAEVPGDGAPYNTVLQPMFEDENYVQGMVSKYYDYYSKSYSYGILLSAVDGMNLESFASVTRKYVQEYKETLMTMKYVDDDGNPIVLDYFESDRYYSVSNFPDYYDINGLMMQALSAEDYAAWKAEYDKIIICKASTDLWFSALMGKQYKTVDQSQYSGVSMHIPLKKYADKAAWFARSYYDTDWAKAVWIADKTDEGDE